jgi:hypothetical protein
MWMEDNMAARRFIFYSELPARGIRYSKAQIRRLRNLPADDPRKFPDPVPGLGKEMPFFENEIDIYIERQLAARTHNEAA